MLIAAALMLMLTGTPGLGVCASPRPDVRHSEDSVSSPSLISATDAATTSAARNPAWAVPIERPGLPNFHQVAPGLYRGAQPTAEGFRELETMGVRTVINLRSFHSDGDEIKGTSLGYEHVYSKAFNMEDEDVTKFLRIVSDDSRGPFFVHCQHGADRTGMMCAAYRIAVQGWSKENAIKEMTEGGFGFHSVWKNIVRYVEETDFKALREKALTSPTPDD